MRLARALKRRGARCIPPIRRFAKSSRRNFARSSRRSSRLNTTRSARSGNSIKNRAGTVPAGLACSGLSDRLFLFGFRRRPDLLIFLLETVHTALGIHQLLPAGKERMAVRADLHADVAFVRRARAERVAAGANHVHFFIGGMNSGFHRGTLSLTHSATKNPVSPIRRERGFSI